MFKKMTGAICGLMAGAMVLGGVINAPLIAEASEGEEVTLRFLGWKTGKEEREGNCLTILETSI